MNSSPTKKHKNQTSQDLCKPAGNIRLVTKPTRVETPVKSPLQSSPFTRPTSISAPSSAPIRAAAVGRFPTSKSFKPFARRNLGTGTPSKARPSAPAHSHAPRLQLSTSEALSKTAPRSKSKLGPVAGVKLKESWNFEIYIDTQQEEMANLMEHSTSILDISDDECGTSLKDHSGKENIPPEELLDSAVSTQSSTNPSRLIQMADEPREPLGELDSADFIPEGVDPSEAILVLEDPEVGTSAKKARSPLSITSTSAVDEPAKQAQQPELLPSETISNIINNSIPPPKDSTVQNNVSVTGDFDIWESGSSTEESASTD